MQQGNFVVSEEETEVNDVDVISDENEMSYS